MTVQELIEKLSDCPKDYEVKLQDMDIHQYMWPMADNLTVKDEEKIVILHPVPF